MSSIRGDKKKTNNASPRTTEWGLYVASALGKEQENIFEDPNRSNGSVPCYLKPETHDAWSATFLQCPKTSNFPAEREKQKVAVHIVSFEKINFSLRFRNEWSFKFKCWNVTLNSNVNFNQLSILWNSRSLVCVPMLRLHGQWQQVGLAAAQYLVVADWAGHQ